MLLLQFVANQSEIRALIQVMREVQRDFFQRHGVDDIWSNSKVFEVVIASGLGHDLIPGHSGSSDALDSSGLIMEYKHFKEQSSNHSWTFNDYSEATIDKLKNDIAYVFFCHIDDSIENTPPVFDWYIRASGSSTAAYLKRTTPLTSNARRMINVSERQLLLSSEFNESTRCVVDPAGKFQTDLDTIFSTVSKLERRVGVKNILTSSKFWEVLVALELGHSVNSEQGGRKGAHDASDVNGNWYEYKISKSTSWNFQDISPNVLKKYDELTKFVLATVDKKNIKVSYIWSIDKDLLIPYLKDKLRRKQESYASRGKELRRLQITLGKREIVELGAMPIVVQTW